MGKWVGSAVRTIVLLLYLESGEQMKTKIWFLSLGNLGCACMQMKQDRTRQGKGYGSGSWRSVQCSGSGSWRSVQCSGGPSAFCDFMKSQRWLWFYESDQICFVWKEVKQSRGNCLVSGICLSCLVLKGSGASPGAASVPRLLTP